MKSKLFAVALGTICILTVSSAFAVKEETFETPDDAVKALQAAVKDKDTNALNAIFGPELHTLVSADAVEASNRFAVFSKRLHERVALKVAAPGRNVLELGSDSWPFPIPLVEKGDRWHFDTDAGKEEILNRRVGWNELNTIRVCHTYVTAQHEYESQARLSDGMRQYAQHLRSSPDKHDGLYWQAEPGEEMSPLGPLIMAAKNEGYTYDTKIMTESPAPYHGYYFKILSQQGRHAPGGKYNYIINGHMVAGFALVAWPEKWDNSGVMTFIVNQHGKVYEKNLGAKTSAIVAKMTAFDPDSSWHVVDGE